MVNMVMKKYSCLFKSKSGLTDNNRRIFEALFDAWVGSVCCYDYDAFEIQPQSDKSYLVEFDSAEDVVCIRMCGIPPMFEDVIEL